MQNHFLRHRSDFYRVSIICDLYIYIDLYNIDLYNVDIIDGISSSVITTGLQIITVEINTLITGPTS